MIHIPTSIPPQKNRARRCEAEHISPEIHRLVHEMVNHLTVLNLCCFKIREAAATRMPAESLSDIANMESAVEQIAALLKDLTNTANTNPPTHITLDKPLAQAISPGSRSSNNVYSLFKR